jgi:hypothetical protein
MHHQLDGSNTAFDLIMAPMEHSKRHVVLVQVARVDGASNAEVAVD